MFIIDDIAKKKLESVFEAQIIEKFGIRVKINGKNAEKYRHDLTLVDKGNLRETDEFIESNGIKVYYSPEEKERLTGTVISYVDDLWDGGFKIENPNVPVWDNSHSLEIQKLFEDEINYTLSMHGGFVELLDVKDNIVYVKMGGGCHGCGMANTTVKDGIEQIVKSSFPEIQAVIDTTDHANGKNPYYQP